MPVTAYACPGGGIKALYNLGGNVKAFRPQAQSLGGTSEVCSLRLLYLSGGCGQYPLTSDLALSSPHPPPTCSTSSEAATGVLEGKGAGMVVASPEQITSVSCWKSQPLRRLLLSLQFRMVGSVPWQVMYFPAVSASWREACSAGPHPSSWQNTVASVLCRPQRRSMPFMFLISGSPEQGLRPFTSRISRKVPSGKHEPHSERAALLSPPHGGACGRLHRHFHWGMAAPRLSTWLRGSQPQRRALLLPRVSVLG